MNMIGATAVSSGMGGADAAVPAGCTAVAANPAQLATTCNRVFSFGGSFLMPNMSVKIGSGLPATDNEDQLFPLPFVGYAQRVGLSRWSIGVGLFAQGGMGVDFKNVTVAANGWKDDLYSEVAFLRLAPTVAYNVNDKLTLGASLLLGYASMEYKFYPKTPGGQEVRDLASTTFAGRVGLAYQASRQWSFGLIYTSESSIDFEGGSLVQNMNGSLVTYRDAKMNDFTWPQQVEAGVAFRATDKLMFAFDITWINWANAIKDVTVVATNPNAAVPAGYETLNVPFALKWEDQWVFAFGVQYELNPTWTLRAGYNYGANPVPSQNLSPLFPAIVEHHLTFGASVKMGDWDLDFAIEHAFQNSDTNNGAASPTNPFAGAEVSHSQNTFHFMVSYRF